jgi:hypothetical protein
MRLVLGWAVSAGLVLAATAASAQPVASQDNGGSPYHAVSDFEEPYGGMPPGPRPYPAPPPYVRPAPYGYQGALLSPPEIYALLRENGFLPLGIPHRRGYAYEISAMDPAGDDGRLIIDARTGRIIRFMSAYWGRRSDDFEARPPYGALAALPSPTVMRAVPRPPAAIPHAGRSSVPMPVPKPPDAKLATPPAKPGVETSAEAARQRQASAAAIGSGDVNVPAPIKPTQDLPPVQGLE